MKLINKKNFFSTVCIVYTALCVYKIIMDTLVYRKIDQNYENFIWILIISVTATLLLSLHYYLVKLPIWLVIIGQYLVLLTFIGLCLWVEGHFVVLHPNAYRDMFVSITIPYIFGASLYYLSFWKEVKKANVILQDIKMRNRSVS